MQRSTWSHSCPAWTMGPRTAHPKFGGGVKLAGIELVKDRLTQLHERFPDDYSSGHNLLEVAMSGQDFAEFNSPNAINFYDLVAGIEEGKFPTWSAFTHPAFGLKGVEAGVILGENQTLKRLALVGHQEAMRRSRVLKEKGIGEGYSIWWPAFDSRNRFGPTAKMTPEQARVKFIQFWVPILKETDDVIAFEYKPSVPGILDFCPTMDSAIELCNEINRLVGRVAMVINLEWAHALIGGETVYSATRKQLRAGLFGGLVHINSAELAVIKWNKSGNRILHGTPGDDKDWACGEGGKKRWNDQKNAVKELDKLGVKIMAEHDIDPSGEDPFACYARSRGNLEQMIIEVRAETA